MLNLVKYRKAFVLFSLLIIVPGFVALLFWHLNVGIDFTQGSRVEFRPQHAMTEEQITETLKPFKLEDLQVILGDNKGIGTKKTVWVDFNVRLDKVVKKEIESRITKTWGTTQSHWAEVTDKSGKTFSQLVITGFSNDITDMQAVKDALNKTYGPLPKTSDPTKGDPTDTATPTATADANTTPTATAAASPTATATESATATPTATATAKDEGENPSNITVEFKEPVQGDTTQTFEILTRTSISTTPKKDTILTDDLQSAFLKTNNIYLYRVSSDEVGPSVAADTIRNSILSVIAASIFILLYIWFSFRKVPRALRYGACAVLALIHDVLVVLGIFSILGHLFNIQVDALFITALLTVIGFSVHDTIVVFDRVRENMQRRSTETFEEVVNASLVQTMARSLNTSLTVLFTLLALTLFTGIGTSIHTFTLTLLIGIASGTYSSIFNASMMLVMWDKGEWFFKFLGEGGHDREDPKHTLRAQRRERDRELARSRG